VESYSAAARRSDLSRKLDEEPRKKRAESGTPLLALFLPFIDEPVL
jgi:hypothetical protein